METVKSIETKLVDINKGLPQLPISLTKWLADYAWLLVLIGVVLSVMSLFVLVPLLLAAFGLASLIGVGFGLPSYMTYGQLGWLNVLLSVGNLLIVLYLEATAIAPLKDKKYRGWQLIFIANLVSLALGMATSIIALQPESVLWSLLSAAIVFYVLLQVRSYFVAATTKDTVHKPDLKAAKPKAKPTK